MSYPQKPESPCIRVCVLDPATGVCLGCYRTIEEITGWASYPDEEKGTILSALPGRRARYAADDDRKGAELPASAPTKRCGQCGGAFVCDAETPGVQCWCASLPHIEPPIGASKTCLCPNCLAEAIAKRG